MAGSRAVPGPPLLSTGPGRLAGAGPKGPDPGRPAGRSNRPSRERTRDHWAGAGRRSGWAGRAQALVGAAAAAGRRRPTAWEGAAGEPRPATAVRGRRARCAHRASALVPGRPAPVPRAEEVTAGSRGPSGPVRRAPSRPPASPREGRWRRSPAAPGPTTPPGRARRIASAARRGQGSFGERGLETGLKHRPLVAGRRGALRPRRAPARWRGERQRRRVRSVAGRHGIRGGAGPRWRSSRPLHRQTRPSRPTRIRTRTNRRRHHRPLHRQTRPSRPTRIRTRTNRRRHHRPLHRQTRPSRPTRIRTRTHRRRHHRPLHRRTGHGARHLRIGGRPSPLGGRGPDVARADRRRCWTRRRGRSWEVGRHGRHHGRRRWPLSRAGAGRAPPGAGAWAGGVEVQRSGVTVPASGPLPGEAGRR